MEIADCREDDEMLLTGGIVKRGTMMNPGSRPLRLLSPSRAVDLDRYEPLPWCRRAVEQLYRLLGLTPPAVSHDDPSGTRAQLAIGGAGH